MGVKLKTSNALLNLLTRTSLCICLVQSATHSPGGYASPKGGESQATSPIYLQILKPSVLEEGSEACFVNADKGNASPKPSRSLLSALWYLGMQPLDKAMLQVVPIEETEQPVGEVPGIIQAPGQDQEHHQGRTALK